MPELKRIIYVPALRMKTGEMEGLRELRSDVADCILPRLIIPPARERKNSSQERLFNPDNVVPDIGGILSKYWFRHDVLVDITYLIDEYDAEDLSSWLPTLFSRARNFDVSAIPCINLVDLERVNTSIFKQIIDHRVKLKIGLVISSGDMTDPHLQDRIESVISPLSIAMTECVALVDFSDADFSNPAFVAPIIQSALEQLQEIGRWQLIVFQGTHYPEKNPAKDDATAIWPRNEWQAWRTAVKFDPNTAQHFVYGDYAADCAKIEFGDQHGRPIPIVHLRYTTNSNWLVVRAAKTGDQTALMKNVCKRIVASSHFSGSSFSAADEYIYDVAHDNVNKAGTATKWRQINTTHHITRVVVDVAKVLGISITEKPNHPLGTQLTLPT